MFLKKYAKVQENCIACGTCLKICKTNAISIWKGVIAKIDIKKCVGCGNCINECPANQIILVERKENE